MTEFHVQENTKYGTVVENTNYGVRNLDIALGGTDRITCYGVGSHRTFHAGVDLYPASLNSGDLAVSAVANGVVTYRAYGAISFPGEVVIIRHTLTNGQLIYSVYMHLNGDTVPVDLGDSVSKGEFLGQIIETPHEGRFPEFHPDGDDTHLHFEMRTFPDATLTGAFPAECNVLGPSGVSYTYPYHPDSYGYLDPLEFIYDRLPLGTFTESIYLPLAYGNPSTMCQEGKDLLLPPPYDRNPGFEKPNTNSAPWHEISNFIFFTSNGPVTYPFVRNWDPLVGNQSAWLNSWGQPGCCGWSKIDEELLQTLAIPDGVTSVDWVHRFELENIEAGDQLIIDLKDALTGSVLANMIVIDENSGYQEDQTYEITYHITGDLSDRDVSLSYSNISDDDIYQTNFVLDAVKFVTHCGFQQDMPTSQFQVTRSTTLLPK